MSEGIHFRKALLNRNLTELWQGFVVSPVFHLKLLQIYNGRQLRRTGIRTPTKVINDDESTQPPYIDLRCQTQTHAKSAVILTMFCFLHKIYTYLRVASIQKLKV